MSPAKLAAAALALALAGCTIPPSAATSPGEAAALATPQPPRQIDGELRAGDDQCPNLCDQHKFTWAIPTRVGLRAAANGPTIFLKVAGGAVSDSSDFGSHTELEFDAEPNVEYTVIVDAYNYYDKGPYTLEVAPPPQVEILAPVMPEPQPPSPEDEEPDDTLPGKIAVLTEGWTRTQVVRGDLAKVPALKWAAKRGRCYRAVMVLESGARKNTDWLWVAFKLDTRAEAFHTSGGFVTGSRRVIDAGGGDLCASRTGTIKLELVRHDTEAVVTDAGFGPFRAELYEQAITGAELTARKRDDDDDYCRSCVKQQTECLQTGDTGEYHSCSKQFSACLYQGNMSKAQCEP